MCASRVHFCFGFRTVGGQRERTWGRDRDGNVKSFETKAELEEALDGVWGWFVVDDHDGRRKILSEMQTLLYDVPERIPSSVRVGRDEICSSLRYGHA